MATESLAKTFTELSNSAKAEVGRPSCSCTSGLLVGAVGEEWVRSEARNLRLASELIEGAGMSCFLKSVHSRKHLA